MSANTLINDQYCDQIPVSDRGFQYGDGVFETIGILNNRPLFWGEHIKRLHKGCQRLGISPPPDAKVLLSQVQALCDNHPHSSAIIKIFITRGQGLRGYQFSRGNAPTRVVTIHHWSGFDTNLVHNGILARICETRLSMNSALAGIKHMNRLENILARAEWNNSDVKEGIMLDTQGHVIEGVMSNIFIIHNNCILTPDLSQSGVTGIMRQVVLQLLEEMAMKIRITSISLDQLLESDEIFCCNSLMPIWPIKKIDHHVFSIDFSRQITARLKTIIEHHHHLPGHH